MPMWEQAVHFNTGFVHDVLHDDRMCAKSLQLCLTLCDTMDCSPPGSSVRGTLRERKVEWAAMPSSRGYSRVDEKDDNTKKSHTVLNIRLLDFHTKIYIYTTVKFINWAAR